MIIKTIRKGICISISLGHLPLPCSLTLSKVAKFLHVKNKALANAFLVCRDSFPTSQGYRLNLSLRCGRMSAFPFSRLGVEAAIHKVKCYRCPWLGAGCLGILTFQSTSEVSKEAQNFKSRAVHFLPKRGVLRGARRQPDSGKIGKGRKTRKSGIAHNGMGNGQKARHERKMNPAARVS